ncbi:hypothetical protein LQV63_26080 [Paenibacillus profundus]|uniref:Uncharacterized protein n=1 Tax=Paenibacillus profundus TaxID=1173085 RepID=A0ABS8YMF9_9BACL|nr:hypothetical protein [Paenibacillus profundus]MCE5172742.1 hypothetical protein [Paenibacillus profundus]
MNDCRTFGLFQDEVVLTKYALAFGSGGGDVSDRYINITRLFKDKLGISVKLDVDQNEKIVTISMER